MEAEEYCSGISSYGQHLRKLGFLILLAHSQRSLIWRCNKCIS
jgi:hypothetical protein